MFGKAYSDAREEMIERHLRGRGIRSPQVLEVMRRVPREHFVRAEDEAAAYSDNALPIDCGQTISQPYIVAAMTEALELTGQEHVLEVGTGSGYQTAVLAELARRVVTIERHEPLARQAQQRLAELNYHNVRFVVGDGARGVSEEAPYDCILVTAAAPAIPGALWEQLREGGRLVGPFGPAAHQTLQLVRKVGGEAKTTDLMPCRFVPLLPDDADDASPA